MAALRQRFDANRARGRRRAGSSPACRPSIAWSKASPGTRATGRLFAATVVGRALLVREARGWRAVDGLRRRQPVRPRRRSRAAACSGSPRGVVEQTPSPETAFRGLIAVDLDTLRPVRRLAVPAERLARRHRRRAATAPSMPAIPIRGAIYRGRRRRCRARDPRPARPPAQPAGPGRRADGRRLYVSDYGYGLAVVDLADGTVTRLESDADTMLDGIDGLLSPGAAA